MLHHYKAPHRCLIRRCGVRISSVTENQLHKRLRASLTILPNFIAVALNLSKEAWNEPEQLGNNTSGPMFHFLTIYYHYCYCDSDSHEQEPSLLVYSVQIKSNLESSWPWSELGRPNTSKSNTTSQICFISKRCLSGFTADLGPEPITRWI